MVIRKGATLTMKRSYSCSMPGVWHGVAHNEGAVVIYHSPKACGHVTHDMDLGSHYRSLARQEIVQGQYTAPLITSGLQEKHSIFGGTEQLRQCVDYVVERYKPEYIVIANSCVAGVIGDDVRAVASAGEEKWHIPILSVESHGFLDSDYYTGFYQAGSALIERFMSKQKRKENTVTLLGDRGGPKGADVQEIKQLLTALGLHVHCQFPGYASVEEIQRVPSSSLCVLLGGRAKSSVGVHRLAADLQDKFEIPFFDAACPVGWQETSIWLRDMGLFLHREEEALYIQRQQEERLQQAIAQYSPKLEKQKAVLCIGRPLLYFQPFWALELLTQARVKLEGIILLEGLTKQQQDDMKRELEKYIVVPILQGQEEERVLETADLIITTHELPDHIKRQFFLPVLPPLGVGGQIALLRKLARLAQRPKLWEGIVYG
jgi:nitrogenase molybdenum-iron protein alpha chain